MWYLSPKKRRKALFLTRRKELGEIFRELSRQKECEILEGSTMSDHVHMCLSIPPKHPVSSIIGFLKVKSAVSGLPDYEIHFTVKGESK